MTTSTKDIKVNIAVTGDFAGTFEGFQKSFQAIAASFTTLEDALGRMNGVAAAAGSAVAAFAANAGKLTVPDKFDKFVTEMSRLSGIKVPDLDKFTTGLSQIQLISVPDSKKMKDIAAVLKSFDGITVPTGLHDLAKGIKAFAEVEDADEAITRTSKVLGGLFDVIKKYKGLTLPNLEPLAKGLKLLEGVNVGAKNTQLLSLSESLMKLNGIKLPNLMPLAQGLRELESVKSVGKGSTLAKLVSMKEQLAAFDGMKLPDFTKVVDGVKKLNSITLKDDFGPKLTKIAESFKAFETVDLNTKFAGDIKNIADAFVAFDKLKPENSKITGLVNTLKGLDDIKINDAMATDLKEVANAFSVFDKIKVPNLSALSKSIKEFVDIDIDNDKAKRLANIADALQVFCGIKVPNLNSLINSLEKFNGFTIEPTLAKRLTSIAGAMSIFDGIKVPNLTPLINSLVKFKEVKIDPDLGDRLETIAKAFGHFKDVKIPTLSGLAKSLDAFKEVKIEPELGTKLRAIADAMKAFTGVKVPAIGAMMKGIDAMLKLDVDAFTKRVSELGTALNKLDEQGKLQSFKGFAEALKAVESRLGRVNIVAEGAREKISRFGFAVASSTAGLSGFNRNLYGMMRGLSALNNSLSNLTGFTVFFGSLYAIKDVSAYFIEFDDAIRKAGTAAEASTSQIEELSRAARLVGEATRYTAKDAALALQELTQAGLSVNESIGALPGVMQLAASAAIDISDAAHISTNIMFGFGMGFEELTSRMRVFEDGSVRVAASINDVLVAAFNRSNTDLTQLGVAFRYAGPIAHSAGMSFEETASILASLAQAGYQGSTAGTTLRRSIANLLSPTKKMKEIMKDYGFEITQANGQMKPMLTILEDMRQQGITTGDALELFGKRAGTGMAALLQMGNIELMNMMTNIESASGLARRNAIEMEAGIGGTWRRLISQWEELKLALGEEIKSNLIGFMEMATKAINENKREIVSSVGAILDFVMTIVKASAAIATFVASNATLIVSTVSVIAVLKTGAGAFAAYRAAQVAANVAALTSGMALGKVVAPATAFSLAWGRISTSLAPVGPLLVTIGTRIAAMAATVAGAAAAFPFLAALAIPAVVGVVYAFSQMESSIQDTINAQTKAIESAKDQAKYNRDVAASLKMLSKEYQAYDESLARANNVSVSQVNIKDIYANNGGDSRFADKQDLKSPGAAEELAFANALERAASAIDGAIVKYDELGHATLELNGKTYETRLEIDRLAESFKQDALKFDVEAISASFSKHISLLKKGRELQEKYKKDIQLRDYINTGNVGGEGDTLDFFVNSYAMRQESVEKSAKAMSENSKEILENRKQLEDLAASSLAAGQTIEEFSNKLTQNKNISEGNKKAILDIATSYEVAAKRIDMDFNTIGKQYSQKLVELRKELQTQTEEYDEAVKELQMDLKEGSKAFTEFKGAAAKIVDIDFGDIDSNTLVRNAKKSLDAVNRVYTEDTSRRKDLIIKAENEISSTRVQVAMQGLQKSLASLESFSAKRLELENREITAESTLIEDSKRKNINLEKKTEEVKRNLYMETAEARVKITEKALSAVEAAYQNSLKHEMALKSRLDSLLKTTEELAENLKNSMSDSIREGLTPVGQYYDKLREIQELDIASTEFFNVGEYEKALAAMTKAANLNATLGAPIMDNGVEVISSLETQAGMYERNVKFLEKTDTIQAEIKKNLESQIDSQEKITNAYAKQAESLTGAIDSLKEVINQGIKIEVKIDLADAEQKLDNFGNRKEIVVGLRLAKEKVQKDIDKINKEQQDTMGKAVVAAVDAISDPAKKEQFFADSPSRTRMYENYKTNAEGLTLTVAKQRKEVVELNKELENYNVIGKKVEEVSKAQKAAEEGRPEALRKIVETLRRQQGAATDVAANEQNVTTATVKSTEATNQYGVAVEENIDNVSKQANANVEAAARTKKALGSVAKTAVGTGNAVGGMYDSFSIEAETHAKAQQEINEKIRDDSAKLEAEKKKWANAQIAFEQTKNEEILGKEKVLATKVKEIQEKSADKKREISTKLGEDLVELQTKHNDTLLKQEETYKAKLEDIDTNLLESRKKINRELGDDLKKIGRERKENEKKVAASIVQLHEQTATKVRAIEDRDATDEVKEQHLREDAIKKVADAEKLLNDGLRTADKEKIERGKELLSQASDMYATLEDQKEAIKKVNEIAQYQEKALNYEARVEFIRKEQEARIAAIAKEREATIKAEDDKAQALKDKNRDKLTSEKQLVADKKLLEKNADDALGKADRTAEDEIRIYKTKTHDLVLRQIDEQYRIRMEKEADAHRREMINIEKRIAAAQGKLLTGYGDEGYNDQPIKESDPVGVTGSGEALKEKKAEILAETTDTVVKQEAIIQKSLDSTVTKATASVVTVAAVSEEKAKIAAEGFRKIEENGRTVFTNLSDEQRNGFIVAADAVKSAVASTSAAAEKMGSGVGAAIEQVRGPLDKTTVALKGLSEGRGSITIDSAQIDESNIKLKRMDELAKVRGELTIALAPAQNSISEIVKESKIKLQDISTYAKQLPVTPAVQLEIDQAKSDLSALAKQASALFQNMDTSDPKQKLQDMVNVINAVISSGTASDKTIEALSKEVYKFGQTVDGVQVSESLIDGKSTYKVLDTLGNELKGTSTYIKSNPFNLFPESHERAIVLALDRIKGAALQATEEKKLQIATDTAKAAVDAVNKELDKLEETRHAKLVIDVEKRGGDQGNSDLESRGYMSGGLAQKFARGGQAFRRLMNPYITAGVPGSKQDDVPAMLQNGEFVQKRAAVKKYGVPFMAALNAGRISPDLLPRFNAGGMVGSVDGFIQKFASGGIALSSSINKMKRRFEDDLFGGRQTAAAQMNVNLNNTVLQASSAMSPMGTKGADALQAAFSKSIARFASGGTTDGASDVAATAKDLNKTYAQQIAAAKKDGNVKLAAILQKEKDELARIAKELTTKLASLEAEYKEFVADTTAEHNERIKDIQDSYLEDDTALDEDHAEEINSLTASYSEKLADLAESEKSTDTDYTKVVSDYKKEKESLKKNYEDAERSNAMAYMAANTEANKVGAAVGKLLGNHRVNQEIALRTKTDNERSRGNGPGNSNPFTDDRAHAGSFTLDETLRQAAQKVGPYSITGAANPDFQHMKNMLFEIWPELKQRVTGMLGFEDKVSEYGKYGTGTVVRMAVQSDKALSNNEVDISSTEYQNNIWKAKQAVENEKNGTRKDSNGNVIKAKKEYYKLLAKDEELRRKVGETTSSFQEFDINYGMQQLSAILDLEKQVESLKPSARRKEYEAALAEIVAKEKSDKTAYTDEKGKYKLDKKETEVAHKSDIAKTTEEYLAKKMERKTNFDTSFTEENTDFEKVVKEKAEDYAADVLEARNSSAEAFKSTKEDAAAQVTEEKKNIDDAIKELTDKMKELSGSITASTRNATSSVTARAKSTALPPDFWKKLQRGIIGYNTGGYINHTPGSVAGRDSIVAALTPGEFVMKESIVSLLGRGFFENLNSFRLPKFNVGGIVGGLPSSSLSGDTASVRHILDLSFNGNHLGELQGQASTIDGFLDALSMAKRRA